MIRFNKKRLVNALILIIIIIYTSVFLGIIPLINITTNINTPSLGFEAMASTNPSCPVILTNNTYYYSDYPTTSQNYYFETYELGLFDHAATPLESSCHLVWLYTDNASSDFDLYLYNDSAYSELVSSSTGGRLDWLVHIPATNGSVYPVVHTKQGTGIAIIEAESSHVLGHPTNIYNYSKTLSENETGELVEYREYVPLSCQNTEITVTLSVPAGCDFDLYVLELNMWTRNASATHQSTSSTLGQDEDVTLKLTGDRTCAIVMLRKSGTGLATVSITSTNTACIPGFEIYPIMMGIVFSIAIVFAFQRKKVY